VCYHCHRAFVASVTRLLVHVVRGCTEESRASTSRAPIHPSHMDPRYKTYLAFLAACNNALKVAQGVPTRHLRQLTIHQHSHGISKCLACLGCVGSRFSIRCGNGSVGYGSFGRKTRASGARPAPSPQGSQCPCRAGAVSKDRALQSRVISFGIKTACPPEWIVPPQLSNSFRRVHSTRRGRGMDLPKKRGST
jgi:hypothetical protein